MKKRAKKLALAKETLGSLNLDLGKIPGGVETYVYPCTYQYASRQKCPATHGASACVICG
jgi:hypothetical protein